MAFSFIVFYLWSHFYTYQNMKIIDIQTDNIRTVM